jgi:hypothetical protein
MLSLSLSGHWGNQDRTPTARKVLGEKMNAGEALANLEGVSSRARRRVENALRSESPGAQQDLSTEDQALLARYIAEEASATTIEPHLVALAETRANSLRTTLVELGAPTAAVRVGTLGPAEQPSVSIDLGASGATEPAATP